MNKRESKKDYILCHGLDVMKTRGYNGTSVKDIVDAACVPKGSFYNYFDSKEAFAIEALEKVSQESYEEARKILLADHKCPMEKLHAYFVCGAEHADECNFKFGCFLGNMCQEMSDSNEVIRVKVQQILKRNTRLFAMVLDEAKAKGVLNEDVDTDVMAEFIFNAWQGALMRMKASKCSEPLNAFRAMLRHMTV
ncbi:TetR/AcrR family transcriptional regulator [Agarilytica rhodophyticola]|uniref:TetR/AcrR family transcriptional regulator n=1 Tax=Agarilytica rhodophyticola TaxID=1737490 RepID=UPI000B3479A9|nr:TetR/AcrR family transcriptional regulator [Agarilytica rhodophyticola]